MKISFNIYRTCKCQHYRFQTHITARIIKVNDTKGSLKPGYDADIIIFDPDINVMKTIVGGRVV